MKGKVMIRYNPGKNQFLVQSTRGDYVEFACVAPLEARCKRFEAALRQILEELGGAPATAMGRKVWKIAMKALNNGGNRQ